MRSIISASFIVAISTLAACTPDVIYVPTPVPTTPAGEVDNEIDGVTDENLMDEDGDGATDEARPPDVALDAGVMWIKCPIACKITLQVIKNAYTGAPLPEPITVLSHDGNFMSNHPFWGNMKLHIRPGYQIQLWVGGAKGQKQTVVETQSPGYGFLANYVDSNGDTFASASTYLGIPAGHYNDPPLTFEVIKGETGK